jgi:hypothetical protein
MPAGEPETYATATPDQDHECTREVQDRNQLKFLPNVTALTSQTTLHPDALGGLVVLKHGMLSVRKLQSCWEFKKDGSGSRPHQRFVGGARSLEFTLNDLPNDVMEFKLGTETLRVRAHFWTRRVALDIGRTSRFSAPVPNGVRNPHFERFYGSGSVDTLFLPYKLRGAPEIQPSTPGDECPPGLYIQSGVSGVRPSPLR